jgi:ABC-2 type transport system ATP-binding protein
VNVIETRALGKSYGPVKALHDCTLAIPGWHVVALVGPNGAGRSTLLNLAVGLAAPSSGEVAILGGFPAGSFPALDGIAFAAQDTPLFKNQCTGSSLHRSRSCPRHVRDGAVWTLPNQGA